MFRYWGTFERLFGLLNLPRNYQLYRPTRFMTYMLPIYLPLNGITHQSEQKAYKNM